MAKHHDFQQYVTGLQQLLLCSVSMVGIVMHALLPTAGIPMHANPLQSTAKVHHGHCDYTLT